MAERMDCLEVMWHDCNQTNERSENWTEERRRERQTQKEEQS